MDILYDLSKMSQLFYPPESPTKRKAQQIPAPMSKLLLRDFGLPANNRQARKACKLLLDGGLQRDGGLRHLGQMDA
jgi:hypothetical protein